MPESVEPGTIHRPLGQPDRLRARPDRLFGRFLVLCAGASALLFAASSGVAPASERPGLFPVFGVIGVTVVLAIWFRLRGSSRPLFVITGLVLMVLGVAIGAEVSDGLDAAVNLPLAGAVLALPVLRGRLLQAMFVVAFFASMAGEIAHNLIGVTGGSDVVASTVISLAASAVMLAFTYGLVGWVGNAWLTSGERTEQALTGQRHLLTLNERLGATLDPEQVLNVIADSLKSVVSFDNLTIYRVDQDAGLLRPVLARDRFASLILESTFPLDRGITGWVATHAEAQCVNDAQRDPRMSLIPGTPAEAESLIVVPLMAGEVVAGTLNLGRMGGPESHFDAADFEMAQLFARQASLALVNADRHMALTTRAMTDELTGLYNRRAFEEMVSTLVADTAAQPLTLLMLDLDGFKAFNDRHGHLAGDALLRDVGGSMQAAVRAGDRVCRYGGDEFAILLPATPPTVGAHVAERITAGIAALDAPRGSSITASVGAASAPIDASNREALVAAADAALYRAKALGGNKVTVAEAAMTERPQGSLGAKPRGESRRSGPGVPQQVAPGPRVSPDRPMPRR